MVLYGMWIQLSCCNKRGEVTFNSTTISTVYFRDPLTLKLQQQVRDILQVVSS